MSRQKRIRLLAGILWVAMTAINYPVQAQEAQMGVGLVCDSPAQITRFLEVVEDDREVAIEQVNAEAKSNACGIVPVAFVAGPVHSTVRSKQGPLQIVSILVVAVNNGVGWMTISPHRRFTVFKSSVVELNA